MDDFYDAINRIKNADIYSKADNIANLYKMLRNIGISCKSGQEIDYYEKVLSENSDNPKIVESVNERLITILYDCFDEFPTPEKYMQRIVNNNSHDFEWEKDSLRLRILKQFIKYCDYLKEAGYKSKNSIKKYIGEKIGKDYKKVDTEDVINNIDEAIFDCIGCPEWNDKKDKLLKTADNLAKGKFRTSGLTKTELYLFAMAYDMIYYTSSPEEVGKYGEIYYETRDIEKNLFINYYHNNLMRFITEEYKENVRAYEAVPSGQGINYKNYAEMVYIYFINKDCPATDKIRLSCNMISDLQKRAKEKKEKSGKIDSNESSNPTGFYKNFFKRTPYNQIEYADDIISLSEEEFEEFILDNYDCENTNEAPILTNREQNTAFNRYNYFIKYINEYDDKSTISNSLWISDTEQFINSISNFKDYYSADSSSKYDDFVLLISKAVGLVRDHKYLEIDSPIEMSRTALLISYYYYFTLRYEDEICNDSVRFAELFNKIQYDLDDTLEECGYQRLSGNNIFDIIIVYSIYAYGKL